MLLLSKTQRLPMCVLLVQVFFVTYVVVCRFFHRRGRWVHRNHFIVVLPHFILYDDARTARTPIVGTPDIRNPGPLLPALDRCFFSTASTWAKIVQKHLCCCLTALFSKVFKSLELQPRHCQLFTFCVICLYTSLYIVVGEFKDHLQPHQDQ